MEIRRVDLHRSKNLRLQPSDCVFEGRLRWCKLVNDEIGRVEDLIDELMRRDEWVVDQNVKNQLLRFEQPPRVDVVEMYRVLRVFADDLSALVFSEDKLARTTRLVRV